MQGNKNHCEVYGATRWEETEMSAERAQEGQVGELLTTARAAVGQE